MRSENLPIWWQKNEATKRDLNIPKYEPPRFIDGIYTHKVVSDLEAEFDRSIRFIGYNTNYRDDWTVQVDGSDVMLIGHHRDENGNTVYEMHADEFANSLRNLLE